MSHLTEHQLNHLFHYYPKHDGLFDQSNVGYAFRTLAIPPEESPFGDWIYIGEFGRDCVCIKRWHPERGLESFVNSLEGSPHGMAFTSGNLFGDNLYVAIDLGNEGKVVRIDTTGKVFEFVSGLQGFLFGNGKDVLQFDDEHEMLYLSDYYGHRIYRIGEEEEPLELKIHGDTTPELNETLMVELKMAENIPAYQVQVTIVNDDGEIPAPEPEPEPEPPPVVTPTFKIAFKTPSNHQSFEMDFTQAPAFANVPIQLHIEGNVTEPRIKLLANDQLIHTFTSPPYTTQWEVEQIGEYLLTASAEDEEGFQIWAHPIRMQVVQSSGNILIIKNIPEDQGEHMRSALFEMGLTGRTVHPDSVSTELLSKADLVIWKHSLQDAVEYPDLSATLFNAQTSGQPLYLLTETPLENSTPTLIPPASWTEITGIPQLSIYSGQNQSLVPASETGHSILLGQYGTVQEIKPKNPIYQAPLSMQLETHVLNTGFDTMVMAAFNPLNTSTFHRGRMVVQLFPLFKDLTSPETANLTSLFQNTVCWLLHCTPCENMDLALSAQSQNNNILSNNLWETEFTLQHVGECAASGVYVDFAWSEHLNLLELVSETGWQEFLPQGVRLHLGTVSSATRQTYLLKLNGHVNQTGIVTSTVHASNGEAILENNQVWSAITVQETETQLKAVMFPGGIPALILPSNLDRSKPIAVEWSKDLLNWISWDINATEKITLIPESYRNKDTSFYRLRR